MTLLHEATDAKKFDSRVVERNIQRGAIKAEDQEKYVKDLPDDVENADWIGIDVIAADTSKN